MPTAAAFPSAVWCYACAGALEGLHLRVWWYHETSGHSGSVCGRYVGRERTAQMYRMRLWLMRGAESACSESLIEEIWLYNLSKKTQRVVKMHPPVCGMCSAGLSCFFLVPAALYRSYSCWLRASPIAAGLLTCSQPPPLIGATCVCTTSTQAFLIGGIGEDGVNTDVYNIDIGTTVSHFVLIMRCSVKQESSFILTWNVDARKCLRAEASRFSSTSDVTSVTAPSHYFHTATVVQSVNTSSSTARLSSRLEYKIVVFGGATNELHEFNTGMSCLVLREVVRDIYWDVRVDTKQWTNIETTGDIPTARILHSATLVRWLTWAFE